MKKIITLIIIVSVLAGTFFVLSKKPASITNNVPTENADLMIFIQQGCSHCEKVEKFIQDNNVMSKLKISYIDIRKNTQATEDIAKKCPDFTGTPLGYLTKDNKCLYGDSPIIDYLKTK